MDFYNMRPEEAAEALQTDMESGLTEKQVSERKEQYGENKLREKKKKTNLQRFLAQFKDVMILILLGAAAVSFVTACMEGELQEFFEPVLILAIVVMNAVIGMLQESRAEKALEALQKMSAPHARVIRQGKERMVEASELVPGDLIRLEAGDFVPADARLLKSAGLKSEESALTGESVPADKDAEAQIREKAPWGDRDNMLFSGCSITNGTALAAVTATGMSTEMGRIADLLEREKDDETPLQQKLAKLGKYLGVIALAACAVVFAVGLYNGIPVMEIFMTAVSLAVSAIPEGLPAIVTIVLSIGVQRMVKQNAIIRSLPAVETLGSASVICSDKTGTLTQNRMTLVQAFAEGMKEPEKIGRKNTEQIRQLLKYAALCCDGTVEMEGEEIRHIGDPTETAIVLAAAQNGMEKSALFREAPRLAEIPFDSDRKLMSTVHKMGGRYIVIVKGAFDILAGRCREGNLRLAEKICGQMSMAALRVLAVAWKEIKELPDQPDAGELEQDLNFLGLVGMIDPPRPEAKKAVEVCRRAGIRPVMITGDHVATASAIAGELGILKPGGLAVTGAQLDEMSEEELDERVEQISVYARVSPENKIRIVKAWQRKGQVVSMTGDGVNDAPALKAADIGCAMGVTGTDVAKGAADMTLTDDNFATIVEAVRQGRGIYANIRKVVGFLLGTNVGEILSVFTAMLLWHKSILLSMQLLWINLVTDSLPAVALGMEAVEPDVMDQRPKPRNEGIFAHGLGLRIFLQGVMFAVLTLTGFFAAERMTGDVAAGRTLAFMVLSLCQIVQVYNMRSEHSLFKTGIFGNHKLNWAALLSVVLVAIVLFTPLSSIFELVRLPWQLYLLGVALILVPLPVMEISKACGLIKHQH